MEKFETENDLRLTIKAEEKEILVDEVCCTSVNIILKNDGQIMTSFLGAHNPEIIKNLEKALKLYFKGIKKTLKLKYNEPDECCCGDENCHGECHEHECECGDNCHCHEEKQSECKSEEKHEHCDCKHDHKTQPEKKSAKTSTSKSQSEKNKKDTNKTKSSK